MFGQPKIHKQDKPLRPILSTSGSFNFSMSKYLVSLVGHLGVNQYTVRDSFTFASEITGFQNHGYVMASFDIKSLFTNIPVAETCDIILRKLFPDPNNLYNGFSFSTFRKMLKNCTENNIFLFNDKLYEQLDGCPMGGCISPTMANVFLSYLEEQWLQNCPTQFKPVVY